DDRTMPPSSLHSSRSRVAVNSTSSTKPPLHNDSTVLSEPSTIRPPVLPRSTRSSPSRRAVPGATALSEARIRPSEPALPPDFPGAAARSLAATALLRSQVPGRPRGSYGRARPGQSLPAVTVFPWGLSTTGAGEDPQRVPYVRDFQNLHSGGDPSRIARYQSVREAQPVGLGEPALHARDASDLAREAHLADRDEVLRQRGVAGRRRQRQGHGQVGRGFREFHPTDRRGVNVPFAQGADAAALFQHREHHRDARGLQAGGGAPGGGGLRVDGERLDLRDQGAAALQGDGQAGAGDRFVTTGQEKSAGVREARDALVVQL